ncbi:S-adenosylmethionine-dependent tRNA (m5U54) methyltransferase [Aureococcus anophagefferens]|nr:S-adenosylmethionine-dependent tRNA (m5U54) methyltransferase [Aureococcus anophagefferens]
MLAHYNIMRWSLALVRVACLSGGRRSRKPRGPRPPPRVLQRVDGGVPEIARCHPERYESLLAAKVASLEAAVAARRRAPPAAEVFESERSGFRMRASFQVWREGRWTTATRRGTSSCTSARRGRNPVECLDFPMGSDRLRSLLPPLTAALQGETLGYKINDARLLTTLAGDALLSLTYNRPLAGDDAWDAAAADFAAAHDVKVVGRSRKYKTAVGADEVREVLDVPGRGTCAYWQTEGAFTQPNANVCRSMLGWAVAATANRGHGDLCELYCGNGCFTVALAPNFRRVVATELSKASVALARRNLAANGNDNARVAKLSAEEFVEAFDGARTFGRLLDAGVDLGNGNRTRAAAAATEETLAFDALDTLFVDPPRAGLDATCVELARRFATVVYVSCNPETLARDVALLAATHDVSRLAAFDQFPTHHAEAGVVLEPRVIVPRRRPRARALAPTDTYSPAVRTTYTTCDAARADDRATMASREYLQRYLSGGDDKKKKKKEKKAKKAKKGGPVKKTCGMKLVDDDDDWGGGGAAQAEESDEDERPQIVYGDDVSPEDVAPKRAGTWSTVPANGRDASPPRRGRAGSDSEPASGGRAGSDSGESAARGAGSDSDASPPRRGRAGSDSDASPPRRGRAGSDSDASPRERAARATAPPRRPRGSDSDASPPRRGRAEATATRARRAAAARGSDSDASPPRRKKRAPGGGGASPPRRKTARADGDGDASPPRRGRADSDGDASPPRRGAPAPTATRAAAARGARARGARRPREDGQRPRGRRAHGRTVPRRRGEAQERRAAERAAMDPEASGKGAATVYRDKRGRKLDMLNEFMRIEDERAGAAREAKEQFEWGRGTKQKADEAR